ncbi:MAG TPA: secretin N-terminal domain-containing protein [Planctomycetota bacterium]|nr:secretin N-terminal domain-containing protein [Planctomycetota bacterium]
MKTFNLEQLIVVLIFVSLLAPPVPAGEQPAADLPDAPAALGALKLTPGDKEDRITLEAADADLVDLVRLIGAQAGLNMIIDPDISGKVSVSFKNVTVDDAMQSILRSNGFMAQKQGEIVRVMRVGLADTISQSKLFQLKAVSVPDIQTELQQFISAGGKLVLHPQKNSFVVIDRPEVISTIESYLAVVDARERQVMIKAQIVEVSLENRDQFGFSWSWLDTTIRAKDITGTVTQTLLPPESGFQVALGNDHFTSVFQALQTRDSVNLLSAPTITTVNNKEAKVEITEDIPYVEATTSVDTGTGSITSTQSVEFVTVGVKLSVLPEIGEDNYIKMKVSPEVSEAPVRFMGIPVVKKRTAETTLLVKSGQTIVLGGLIRENVSDEEKRVPVLSSIPILGNLFKSKDKRISKVELLIFIRPIIIDDAIAAAEAEESEMRISEKKEEYRNPDVLPKLKK